MLYWSVAPQLSTRELNSVSISCSPVSGFKLVVIVFDAPGIEYPWAFWDPADGRLRWEYTNGNIPTVHGDDPNALRWIRTGPDTLKAAPPFAGMMYFADAREDFLDTFLTLYRWPKAGETVDLTTKSTQGRFATISNALRFDISEGAMFNGNCKPKNN